MCSNQATRGTSDGTTPGRKGQITASERAQLTKLLGLWPDEAVQAKVWSRRDWSDRIDTVLRCVRQQAMHGHWAYAPGWHAELLTAYRQLNAQRRRRT